MAKKKKTKIYSLKLEFNSEVTKGINYKKTKRAANPSKSSYAFDMLSKSMPKIPIHSIAREGNGELTAIWKKI